MLQYHKSTSAQSHFQGVARKVDIRTDLGNRTVTRRFWLSTDTISEIDNIQILTFRLELTDNDGNIFAHKAVELGGKKIFGVISDGDTVEVVGHETGTGIFQPQRIFNLTTDAEITTELKIAQTPKYQVAKESQSPQAWTFIFVAIPASFMLFHILSPMFGASFATIVVFVALAYSIYKAATHKQPSQLKRKK